LGVSKPRFDLNILSHPVWLIVSMFEQ